MGFTPQYLAYYLGGVAGASSPDGHGLYVLSEEDGDLFEKLWLGDELADQVYIASGVKDNTPGLYLLNQDSRGVFYLDTENKLQYSAYDADEEEWEEVTFEGDGQITVHSSSQLSGTFFEGGQIVFFEETPGQLRAVHFKDGTSTLLPRVPAGIKPGTPHNTSILKAGKSLHLVYLHLDGNFHHLSRSSGGSEWQDAVLPGTQFTSDDDDIAKFLALSEDGSAFQIFVLTAGGKLIWIDEQGARDEFGAVVDGQLVRKSSEENTRSMMKLMESAVNSATGARKS